MWLQLLIGFKQHLLLWIYPIYFMNLPFLWVYTYEEANTPSLMRYLFGTVSGAIRLAQPISPGQHRSSAFPCRALPALGSSRPGILGAKGMLLHRHVPEVVPSSWPLPTQVERHASPWWKQAHLHLPARWSRQNLSVNKQAQFSRVLFDPLPHLCVHHSHLNEDPSWPYHILLWGWVWLISSLGCSDP